MTRNRLYTIVMIGTISGLFYFLYSFYRNPETGISWCLFKNATGYPCPSCGTTRAMKHLVQAEFYKALVTNPLSYLMALVLFIVPVWVGYDAITRKSGFFQWYQNGETLIRKRPIAFLFIGLILANWIWNIFKKL
jgi:hypothetical protein